MRHKLNQILKIAIPLLLGLTILYFLYRKTNINELWANIKGANWLILSFSLIFGLSANVMRGLRWELLITPLGYHPRRSNLVFAVLGNYAVNFAIPRAGEIWRCGVITQKEKIPFSKLLETLLIDRIFDILPVFVFSILAVWLNFSVFHQHWHDFQLPGWLRSPHFYVGILGFVALSIAFFVFLKDNFISKALKNFYVTLKKDIPLLKSMNQKPLFLIYTFSIWIAYFFHFYIALFAFDFTAHLGFQAALLVFVLGSVSMLIPSNGGLGPWQAAVIFGLSVLFTVPGKPAEAFAIGVFAFQSLWMVLCGFGGMVVLSIRKEVVK